jgi:hypothetical protein
MKWHAVTAALLLAAAGCDNAASRVQAAAPDDADEAEAHSFPADYEPPELPPDVLKALRKGTEFEIVSLLPDDFFKPAEGEETLYGNKVLGRTRVSSDATRQELVDALVRGNQENDGGAADCFWPRHALVAKYRGRRYELVICFECLQIEIRVDGKAHKTDGVLTSKSPQPVFDRVLKQARVPLPPAKAGN